jgi:hypothetical protein
MDMSPPTPYEVDSYPHVVYTSDMEWNPQRIVEEYPVQDLDLTDKDLQHNEYNLDTINAYGELLPVARQQDNYFRHKQWHQPEIVQLSPNLVFPLSLYPTPVRPYNPIYSVRLAFPDEKTLQKSFPAANVICLNEVIATDTYFLIPQPLMYVLSVMSVSWNITGMNPCILSSTS